MKKDDKKISFESKIQGMFKTSNHLFGLGANIGIKSFEHLITISSAALGLLFSYQQGLFGEYAPLNFAEKIVWLFAVTGFAMTIVASIKRNYHAGNGLVFKSDYIRSRAHKEIKIGNKKHIKNVRSSYKKLLRADKYRIRWSRVARASFLWGIGSLSIFILFEDIANAMQSTFQFISELTNSQYIQYLGTKTSTFIILILINLLNTILIGFNATEKKEVEDD